MSSLDLLLTDGIIEEVITRLKSGKEADLYLVQHRGEIVAAKIYKERHARNFHNNAAYREGRTVRNTRTQRAIDKGSRFGQAAAEEAWKATESDALHKLHAVGMRVPQPILFYEGILLMEVVVDAEGHPAPRLIDAHVPKEVAAPFYADLRSQAVKMLTCDLIHGDLSPYNVLLAWNGPTIIDFPQVIGAAHNRQAASFFERDLRTLHRFFAAIDPSLNAHAGDAQKIWRAYERRELTADFVPAPGEARLREHVPGGRRDQGPRHGGRRPGPEAGPPGGQRHREPPARPDETHRREQTAEATGPRDRDAAAARGGQHRHPTPPHPGERPQRGSAPHPGGHHRPPRAEPPGQRHREPLAHGSGQPSREQPAHPGGRPQRHPARQPPPQGHPPRPPHPQASPAERSTGEPRSSGRSGEARAFARDGQPRSGSGGHGAREAHPGDRRERVPGERRDSHARPQPFGGHRSEGARDRGTPRGPAKGPLVTYVGTPQGAPVGPGADSPPPHASRRGARANAGPPSDKNEPSRS